jgi:hypothetical protein
MSSRESRVHRMLPAVLHGRDWNPLVCERLHILSLGRTSHMGKDSQFQIARGQPWNYTPDAFKN